MTFPKDTPGELDAYYTRPDGSARWEVVCLTYIQCPWKIYTSWDPPVEYTKGIRIHKKCAESLSAILDDIWQTFGKSQDAIRKAGLDRLGGSYFYRPKRASRNLSLHAYGAAIDWDPVHNAMGSHHGKMDPLVVDRFQKHGWTWGGSWSSPDFMHFQMTDNGKAIHNYTSDRVFNGTRPIPAKPPRRKINDATLALVKRFEAFRATQYSDAGHPAIGYGRRDGFRDFKITPGMVITEEIASAWLRDDLEYLGEQIAPLIKVTLTDNQFGALVSFQYNTGGLAKSTLLKELNVGDFPGAKDQFKHWCKYTNPKTGKKEQLPGLLKRRLAEAELFGTP